MEIIECKTTDEILASYPILVQLYPIELYSHMEYESYKKLIPEMQNQGYRQIGAFEDGKCLGVAGFNSTVRLYLGHIMRLNDIVVDMPLRGQGIGISLLRWVEEETKRLGLSSLVLDSTLAKEEAHRFYAQEGYMHHAFHFIKRL